MKLKLQTLTNVPASKPIIAYKKLDRNLRSPIWNFQYTEGKDHKNINFNPDPKQQETNRFYSIAPPKIKEVHYPFGVRLFKVAIWEE